MTLFAEIRDDVWTRICEARSSFVIFMKLCMACEDPEDHDALRQFESFFSCTIDAHEMMFIMRLSVVFDASENGKRHSLHTLCNLVKNELVSPTPEAQEKFKKTIIKISSLYRTAEQLISIRNKYFGHRLSEPIRNVAANKLNYTDVENLLDSTEEVYRELSSYIDNSPIFHVTHALENTQDLIALLRSIKNKG
jgi:hypothetical protein